MQAFYSNLLAAMLVIQACFGCCRQVVAGVGVPDCCKPTVNGGECCKDESSAVCTTNLPAEAPPQTTCHGTCIYVLSDDDGTAELCRAELVTCAEASKAIASPSPSTMLTGRSNSSKAPPLRLHLLHQILLI